MSLMCDDVLGTSFTYRPHNFAGAILQFPDTYPRHCHTPVALLCGYSRGYIVSSDAALVKRRDTTAKALKKPRGKIRRGINAYKCPVCQVHQDEAKVERIFTGAKGGEKITRFRCNCGRWHQRVGKGRWHDIG